MLYQLSYFRKIGGQRWIRTTEGVSQQIYSLPHLATLVFAHLLSRTTSNLSLSRFVSQLRCKGTSFFWICKRWDDFFLKKSFRSSREAFHFFFPKKRNETKKIRRLRSEAKICTFFLKKKNSLTLKQLFLFNEKSHKFLHASPLMPEVSGVDVYKTLLRSFFGCPADGCRTLLRSFGDVLRSFVTSFLRMTNVRATNEQENINEQRAKQCCAKAPASSFLAWNGGGCWSVKNKKLFER